MRAVIVGVGAVGARAARQLLYLGPLDDVVVIDADGPRADAVAESLGAPARVGSDLESAGLERGDVVVFGTPGSHRALAEVALGRGAHVVSVSDHVDDVRDLLALDGRARDEGRHVVVGAGFSPGLSCVLAALAARSFERVEEIHVAKVGTGGPECARQHHRALAEQASDWREGNWEHRNGGSGRELCWFPDPVCGVDCYRAALAETALLVAAFPDAHRVTARVGASRRDRLTARLPMLRRPHPEGDLGAVRVEVRGAQGSALDDRVLGAVDRPAVAAGTVAALSARWAMDDRLAHTGASGLAGRVEPGPFLAALAERGLKVAVFEGSHHGAGTPAAAIG
ncbi:MAG: Gfo/Idh/MocA family oxidoreductase [Acidimicrobiales bacterium]